LKGKKRDQYTCKKKRLWGWRERGEANIARLPVKVVASVEKRGLRGTRGGGGKGCR